MNTNDMTHPVVVQVKEGSVNNKGDPCLVWNTVWEGYASVRNLSYKEYWEAAAISAEQTLKLVTRWHPALDITDPRQVQILWHGRTLDVRSIGNVGWTNEFVEFRAVVKNE